MSDGTATNSAQTWLEQTRDLERRGEFLRAYDTASQGLEEFPDDLWLRYRAVLVLARAGATQLARQRYAEYGLEGRAEEDIAALAARLSKDAALMAAQKERATPAASAAEQYETIYLRTSGYFPGINAATLSLVAGNADHARELAQEILSLLGTLDAGDGEEAYYRLATQAEALLILGREDEAKSTLAAAFAAVGDDLAALATTRKQLALICEVSGLSSEVLAEFTPPRVIHYCGHIIKPLGETGRFSADQEPRVAQAIRDRLTQSNVGFGYGSLAAGADILFAEALLDRGAELHVALPFRKDEFIDVSVAPSGGNWVTRFEHCMAAATSVRYATEDSYLGDDQLFSYCSAIGMGLVILRARYLDGPVEQIAVWDGTAPAQPVGTAFDVAQWRTLDLPQSVIPVPGSDDETSEGSYKPTALSRVQRAMLFGDIKGFSKLGDRDLPVFVDQILGRLADVIDSFGDAVVFRNTWGDGIFVVFEQAKVAARCAMAMQVAMAHYLADYHTLPDSLGLRLGGHFGPIYRTRDPVLKVENYFGAHVSRAARIEPVTPEGSVYVTESFAARLALDDISEFTCDYVGSHPAAKGYGNLPMYLLRRIGEETDLS